MVWSLGQTGSSNCLHYSHLHCCYIYIKKLPIQKSGEQDLLNRNTWVFSDTQSQNWLVTNWSAEQFVATTKSNCWKKLSSLLEISSTSVVTSTIGFSCWARWSEHSARYKKTNKQNNKLIRLVTNCHHPEPARKKRHGNENWPDDLWQAVTAWPRRVSQGRIIE